MCLLLLCSLLFLKISLLFHHHNSMKKKNTSSSLYNINAMWSAVSYGIHGNRVPGTVAMMIRKSEKLNLI